MDKNKQPMTYKDAGVDIDEGIKAVNHIKERMKNTVSKNVLSGIGGFGGIIDISNMGYKQPVMVSSADGVGTKVKIASALGKYEGIGRDIVSHCINDIAVQGAKPLFFLDYIGISKLDANLVDKIIAGILSVCKEEDCVLLGGETAEMPNVYCENEFDLVGTIVGIMEKDNIISGKNITEDSVLIGLPSVSLHTNGYSLARKVLLDSDAFKLTDTPDGLTQPLGDELLIPHRCYGKIIQDLCDRFDILGMAHITGGGLIDNLPRVLPSDINAVINTTTWPVLPIFNIIQHTGNIEKHEMFRVFNMGIGLVFIVDKNVSGKICDYLEETNTKHYLIGHLTKGSNKVIIE